MSVFFSRFVPFIRKPSWRRLRQSTHFPLQIEIAGAVTSANDLAAGGPKWQKIGTQWVSLAFTVVREARWAGNSQMFQKWITRIEPLAADDQQRAARWHHETCLWHVMAFEFQQARTALNNWPEGIDVPFWEVRRSELLAEFDQSREALTVADRALDRIRSQLRPYLVDYEVMSEEGLAMLLSNIVTPRAHGRPDFAGEQRAQTKRWGIIAAYDCNPWTELRSRAKGGAR